MLPKLSNVRLTTLAIVGAFVVALGFTALDIVPAASQEAVVRAWRVEASADLADPWSSVWGDVDPATVALSAQNAAKPLGGGEVATVKARALHDGRTLYVLLEWKDGTLDDTVNGHTAFTDAAAIEYPATASVSVPSFCMGDANASVNIWQWKAAWQRDIDVGYATVRDRYPNTQSDSYLFQDDPVFQPARSLGNPFAQLQHNSPVENLVAASFGTLTTADLQDVAGNGQWKDGRWRVVFSRPLTTAQGYPSLAVGDITNVAFAVWDGSKGNRDGLKSVSQFMNLSLSASVLPPPGGGFPWWGWAIIGGIGATAVAGLAWAYLRPIRAGAGS